MDGLWSPSLFSTERQMFSINATGDLPPVSVGFPLLANPHGPKDMYIGQSLSTSLSPCIGPYKILGLLGSGGMGVVYLVEQEQPRRQIALEVMKPGVESPELLRRFELEAQALGQLQHEGIARIDEADIASADGGRQPYFAMEIIQGQPSITRQPGQAIEGGPNGVTLAVTETGNNLVAAGLYVTVFTEGASEIQLSASATVTLRPPLSSAPGC